MQCDSESATIFALNHVMRIRVFSPYLAVNVLDVVCVSLVSGPPQWRLEKGINTTAECPVVASRPNFEKPLTVTPSEEGQRRK
jgi:hypothetical protein